MAGLRVIIVTTSLVFALGWSDLLKTIFWGILALVPFPYTFFHVQYVQDHHFQESDDVQLDETYDDFEGSLKENERQMRGQLMEVVNMMESFLDDSEMDEMSEEEVAETFSYLDSMFPVIDRLFDTILREESVLSINPEADYLEVHRRYLVLKNEIEKKRDNWETINDDDIRLISINNTSSLEYDDSIVADEL